MSQPNMSVGKDDLKIEPYAEWGTIICKVLPSRSWIVILRGISWSAWNYLSFLQRYYWIGKSISRLHWLDLIEDGWRLTLFLCSYRNWGAATNVWFCATWCPFARHIGWATWVWVLWVGEDWMLFIEILKDFFGGSLMFLRCIWSSAKASIWSHQHLRVVIFFMGCLFDKRI